MPPIAFHDLFSELAILLLLAALAGAVAVRLRQPLVLGFIAIGVLVGPAGLNYIAATDQIHLFGEMGLALLLFVVGLKLDLHLLRTLGPIALAAGACQIVVTAVLGLGLALLLGFPLPAALLIAVALTFSSTIIIVKLLSDKHETESLHGRLALGVLLVQDLVAILVMLGITSLGTDSSHPPLLQVLTFLGKAGGLLLGVWAVTIYGLPRVLALLSRSTELLVLVGIAWALTLGHLGDLLGLGLELGAFLAGLSLASTPYREILGAKLVSLRDFLLLFFFVELGTRLELTGLAPQLPTAVALIVFVMAIKPLVVLVALSVLGYRKRTSFLTGLTLAQMSEFSLIVLAMGAAAGLVRPETVGMVTLVGLVTIGLSSALIEQATPLYERLTPALRGLDRLRPHREDGRAVATDEAVEVVLFGLGSYGTQVADTLRARGRRVLGVDFDPQAVAAWEVRGWPAILGDAEDPDFAAALPLFTAAWVVSAIRDPQINRALLHGIRQAGYTGSVALAARDRQEGEAVLGDRVGLLLVPAEDAAVQAVDLLQLHEEQIARATMDQLIDSITNHYIICGYGRMGQQIVKDLRRQQVPFVVIENNPEQMPRLKLENIPYLKGKGSHDDTLQRAGIARAQGLIAVAASDEENVFIVLTARGLNPRLFIVARSIREENEDKIRRAGADRVMSPYILGGRRMAAAVTKPGVMDFLDLLIHSDQPDIEIAHAILPAPSPAVGLTLGALNLWQQCGVTVLAVQRLGEAIHANPSPEFILRDGDELILMGSPVQLAAAAQCLQTALHTPSPQTHTHFTPQDGHA
jgi:Kef-type K+ transport system membrane component KefB/Trk K+ transport system NAD-binding subunit